MSAAFNEVARAAADLGPYLASMGHHLREIHSLLAEAVVFEAAVVRLAAVTGLPVDRIKSMLRNHPADWQTAVHDLFPAEVAYYGVGYFWAVDDEPVCDEPDAWQPPPAGRYLAALVLIMVLLTCLI